MSTADSFDRGLLSPGTVRADSIVSDDAITAALVQVEVALVTAWERAGVAPTGTGKVVRDSLNDLDLSGLPVAAVSGGNPVIPLVPLLRAAVHSHNPEAARWVHRGATSPEILDSAMMLVAAAALDVIEPQVRDAARMSAELADRHRHTLQVGRTLTQHSTPIVFGTVPAQWALGLSDAANALARTRAKLPVQLGGASGNLASFVEIAGETEAAQLPRLLAAELGLRAAWPWLVRRTPVTRLGDALVTAVDVAGVIASDVAVLSRSEIAELSEGETGGSSTMPQKQNPVASVLLRSISLRAPGLGADLHRSSATSVDQRPDGAWHAEWPALRELLRLTLGASDLLVRLVGGLHVDVDRMAETLRKAGPKTLSERVSLVSGPEAAAALLRDGNADAQLLDPATYVGISDRLIDMALATVTR